jgi:acetyl esterase/lipase
MKGVTFIHDVEIGKGGDSTLHAEIAYPETPSSKPMPAVIWIHGGGWSRGSYKVNPAKSLALHGYFTASIEYRLSGVAIWPAQLEDCRLAVRWLRANAAKYNIDPDHIGVWGASAGTMADQKQFDGTGGYPDVSSKVQAVAVFAGPVDFNTGGAGIQKMIAKPPDYESPGLIGLFGGTFEDKGALWKQGSPINYISANDPPFLVVSGDKDLSVPHTQAIELNDALTKAGVPVQFITVHNGGHGMHAAKGDPPATPDHAALAAAVLAFFDKYLKPNP